MRLSRDEPGSVKPYVAGPTNSKDLDIESSRLLDRVLVAATKLVDDIECQCSIGDMNVVQIYVDMIE